MVAAPMPTSAESREAELWDAYRADPSIANRNALVVHYLAFITAVATTVAQRLPDWARLDKHDLHTLGAMALMEIIPRYEPGRGKFTSWAYCRMRGAMLDEIRAGDIPRLMRQRLVLEDRITTVFLSIHGTRPTERQIRLAMKLDAQSFGKYRKSQLRQIVPIPIEITDHGHERETLADTRQPEPDARLLGEHVLELMAAHPGDFNPNHIRVIRLYYFEGMTGAEIARQIGYTESGVHCVRKAALARLRTYYADQLRERN